MIHMACDFPYRCGEFGYELLYRIYLLTLFIEVGQELMQLLYISDDVNDSKDNTGCIHLVKLCYRDRKD